MPRFSDIPQFTQPANYRVDISLRTVINQLDHWKLSHGIDLDPDFQRGHVWTLKQRIAYIEFLLRGGTGSNIILFNHPYWMSFKKEAPVTLVDGKQRITSAFLFLQDQIPIFGQWVFSDFEDELSWNVGFVFCVNNLKTRRDVLQWYLEINSGGTPHSNEELENVRLLLQKEIAKNAKQ